MLNASITISVKQRLGALSVHLFVCMSKLCCIHRPHPWSCVHVIVHYRIVSYRIAPTQSAYVLALPYEG